MPDTPKITNAQVKEMRVRAAAGERFEDLAQAYGTTVYNVTMLAAGRLRRYAGGPITRRLKDEVERERRAAEEGARRA